MADETTAGRLEILLVAMWVDLGMPDDGEVELSLADACDELETGGDRRGQLAVLAALGELEESGAVRVRWAGNVGGPATVTLSRELTRDARGLFGR